MEEKQKDLIGIIYDVNQEKNYYRILTATGLVRINNVPKELKQGAIGCYVCIENAKEIKYELESK